MSTPSASSDFVKRVAALAVSRFGADRLRVQRACQALVQAQHEGISGDLLDMFIVQKLLTPAQAEELRHELSIAHLSDTDEVVVEPIAPPPKPVSPTRSGHYLCSLGEYRLLRKLGAGGMGTVYLAYQESADRQVAIKALADHLAGNQSYVSRFHREAKSGSVINHPNIVRCIAAGRDEASGKHYLVMEFVDGPSARALLDRFGKLALGDAVHIALDIARALEHVHALNFVHRDIKPDNILITQSGIAKLADLGLAKWLGDSSSMLTARRSGFGTPFYMPCEQALDATQADARCDIYALGATLYHLVTGDVPFPGDSHLQIAEKKLAGVFPPASSLNPQVPPDLDRILARMLAREPGDRYQTASEVFADLERTQLDVPVPSFVDPDLARKDPLMQVRMTVSDPTLLDLAAPRKPVP